MKIKESSLIRKIKNIKNTDFVFVAKECEFLDYEKLIENNNRSPYDGMIYVLLSPFRYAFQLVCGYGLLKTLKNIGQ